MATRLPVDRELTVVTHAVGIALSLANRSNITVMLVGGRLRGRTQADIDTFITDAGIDPSIAAEIATAGPQVIAV